MKLKRLLGFVVSIAIIFSVSVFEIPARAYTDTPSWQRLAGDDRYKTAIKISDEGWDQANTVLLATGQNFPDALCAAPLAKKYDAPILLTRKDALDSDTASQLKKLNTKRVYIIGGTGVISPKVEEQVKALVPECVRIGGANRFETSALIAEKLGNVNEVVVATGYNYPDALSIAPIAAAKGIPVLLSSPEAVPDSIDKYLKGKDIQKSYVIGGLNAISQDVYDDLKNPKRLLGGNRYETNIAVLDEFFAGQAFDKAYVATGNNFPDALTGSALAALSSSPLVLTADVPYDITLDFAKQHFPSVKEVYVLGGDGVVTLRTVTTLLHGGLYYTIVNEGEYEYIGNITLQNTGSTDISDVNFQIDIGNLSTSPYQKDEGIEVSGTRARLVTDISGNKKVLINLSYLRGGQQAQYTITRKFTNGGIKYDVDLSQASGDYSGFKDFIKYTYPEEKIESDNKLIKDLAAKVVGSEKNPYLKAKKIFAYVNTTLEYDFSEANKGALNAINTGKGVCEDFSDLFVAMARAQGIPSRVVSGYWVQDISKFGMENPANVNEDRHAWVEFYLPEYGWIVAEPTYIKTSYFGSRLPAYEVFGNLDDPGHFLSGYTNSSSYQVNYEYGGNTEPNINIDLQEYIKEL